MTPRLAPTPSSTRDYPWAFIVGQTVYVVGRPQSDAYQVVGGELWKNFPHYRLIDAWGAVWRVPQIHLSSKPISNR